MFGFIALRRSLHIIYPFPFYHSLATQVLFKVGIMEQINLRGISTAATGTRTRGDIVQKEEIEIFSGKI